MWCDSSQRRRGTCNPASRASGGQLSVLAGRPAAASRVTSPPRVSAGQLGDVSCRLPQAERLADEVVVVAVFLSLSLCEQTG